MGQTSETISPHVVVGIPSTDLALSDHLIQTHGVHCITKPLSRRKLLQILAKKQQTHAAVEIKPTFSKKLPLTVMAVDDNPANLKLISALLQERVEKVVTHTNGLDAVTEAEQQAL